MRRYIGFILAWLVVFMMVTNFNQAIAQEIRLSGDTIFAISWNQSSTYIAIGYNGGIVKIKDTLNNNIVHIIQLPNDTSKVISIDWNLDESKIAVSTIKPTVYLLDTNSWEVVNVLPITHGEPVLDLEWHTDNIQLLGISPYDGSIYIWDTLNNSIVYDQKSGGYNDVNRVKWYGDNILVASANATSLLDTDDNLIATLGFHDSYITSLSVNPVQTLYASGDMYAHIRIWNIETGVQLFELNNHNKPITALAWSPDGSQLASGSYDGKVNIWDTTSGQLLNETDATGPVVNIEWSPSGDYLVYSGDFDDPVNNAHIIDPYASAPISNPGADQTIIAYNGQPKNINLDGSGSYDVNGTIVSYKWKDINKNIIATTINPMVTLPIGIHKITLTVMNNSGLSTTSTTPVTITILGSPISNPGLDQTVIASDGISEWVKMDGTGSMDVDGTIIMYKWIRNESLIGTTPDVLILLSVGQHKIYLEVVDDSGLRTLSADPVTITVLAQPTPILPPNQTVVSTNGISANVTLDGSGSSDPDGTIISYEWKEGNTTIATGVNPTVELSMGVHEIYLTVTDDSTPNALSTTSTTPVKITVIGKGWIVFGSNRYDSNMDIYVAPQNGTADSSIRMTNDVGGTMYVDRMPTWSPDNKFIAFQRRTSGTNDIWIIPVANPQALFKLSNTVNTSTSDETNPSWSQSIAYVGTEVRYTLAYSSDKDGDADIYKVTFVELENGTFELRNNTNLTNAAGTAADTNPNWSSPDGTYNTGKIVFVSDRDGSADIYTMSTSGTNVQQVTNDNETVINTSPDFSADGRYIGYTSNRSGGDNDIWVSIYSTTNGTWGNNINLTSNRAGEDRFVTWYRDQNTYKIVFATSPSGTTVSDIAILPLTKSGSSLVPGTLQIPAWNSTNTELDPDV